MRGDSYRCTAHQKTPTRWAAIAVLGWFFLVTAAAGANEAETEINRLIDAVAVSDCQFIRNGKTYDAHKAAEHLRLKYRRGRRYADTAEHFIERLASKSSMSRKPYFMECADQPRIETGAWLTHALAMIRQQEADAQN